MRFSKIDFPVYITIIIIAILMAYTYIYLMLKKGGKFNKNIFLYFILSFLLTFVCGKLFSMVFDHTSFIKAGLSSYGGLIGVILSSLIFEKIMPLDKMLIKYSILSLPMIYGISKIACFIVGCCTGLPYDGFFSITYVDELNIPLFPVQLLETIVFLTLFIIFNKLRKNKNIIVIVAIFSSLAKFLLDFLRYNHLMEIITVNQIFSLFLLFLSIAIFFKRKRCEKMFCRNCGTKLDDGAKFCKNCGISLENNNNLNANMQLNNSINSNSNIQVNKKNNKGLIIGITIGILLLLLVAVILIINKNSTKNVKTLNLENFSIKYDADIWKTVSPNSTIDNGEALGLESDDLLLVLMHINSLKYYTTESFAKELIDSYNSSGKTVLNNSLKTINNIEWKIIEYSDDNYSYYMFIYANNYDIYSLAYKAPQSSYQSGLSKFKDVYETLTYSNVKDINSQETAKAKLIGEWDWGKLGYIVISDDYIYVYQDASKSMNNVYYGTYKAENGIPTNGQGYVNGIHVIANFTNYYLNGVKTPMATAEREVLFIPNSDGTYTIKDYTSNAVGIAKKVK